MSKKSHPKEISKGMRTYWSNLREELEDVNRVMQAMGKPTYTLHEYRLQLEPKAEETEKPKGKKALSEEHKRKLSERAKELDYADRLRPYMGQGKKELTREHVRKRKAKHRLERQKLYTRKKAAMRFARECMAGVHGIEIRNSILEEIGSLNTRDDEIVKEAVEHLIELGFLEPFSKVSAATRKKMSESAHKRYLREKIPVWEAQESIHKKWEDIMAEARKEREK